MEKLLIVLVVLIKVFNYNYIGLIKYSGLKNPTILALISSEKYFSLDCEMIFIFLEN